MTETSSKITIHMVSSLDGFIAKINGDTSWMNSHDQYEKGITLTEDYVNEFLQSIDCYVMGAHTYEHALALGWPYGDTPVVVVTHRELESDRKNVSFYKGDLKLLTETKLKVKYQNIWMVGGAELTRLFILNNLVDHIVISIMPTLLGNGLPFFDQIGKEIALNLYDVKTYNNGIVELNYKVK